jgi:hypothetical protein
LEPPEVAFAGLFERNYGRAPAARFAWGVAEIGYKIGAGQDRPDHLPLDADAAAVNDPQSFEAHAPGLFEIFFNDLLHVRGRDSVEIENVGNRNPDRLHPIPHKPKARSAEADRAKNSIAASRT